MDISSWIDRHAAFDPAKPAIRFEGRVVTYGGFADMIAGFAGMLKHEFGVGRGDRVAYLGFNSPELLAMLFAAARLGALFTPLNWRLARPEIVFILKDAAVKVLLSEEEFKDDVDGFRGDLPNCQFLAVDFAGTGWRGLDAALARASDPGGDDRNPHVSLDTPLLLVYTSGTTGHPKGAVLNQGALFINALNAIHAHDLTRSDHILTVLPMFHVGGLNILTTPALYAGATVTLHRRFEPAAALEAIALDRPSLVVLVPAIIDALTALPEWENADLGGLRCVTTGSSIVPLPVIEAFHRRGVPVIQIYGATETCPVVVYQRIEDAFAKPGTSGKPGLHNEVRIVDDDGGDVTQGASGEILVRGGNIFVEYWGNQEATAEALRDGWFHTGDIGYADADGDIFINDRKSDVIISGSENIYPAEIEAVLHGMADVADNVVVGRADEKWGEVAVCVIVPAAGAEPGKEEILARFDGVLARFKHPRDVLFVEELPRNVMGKVLKYEVREMIAGAHKNGSGKP